MTKPVATQLVIFAGLMFIIFGLKTGLSEHYLAPTGITENAYSSERGDVDDSPTRTDLDVLSCGSAWSPFVEAVDPDDEDAAPSKSRLSDFGVERCQAVLAGTGWSAALLAIAGSGVWLILLLNAIDRWLSTRRHVEDEEMDRLIAQKRLESERRRQTIANASD